MTTSVQKKKQPCLTRKRKTGMNNLTLKKAKELMDRGVPSIHFYSLNATESVRQVAKSIY